MSAPALEDLFFHQNMMLYTAKHQLAQKQAQADSQIQSLDRLENVIDVSEMEIECLITELRATSFELMLHTPCRKFDKLLGLLDF